MTQDLHSEVTVNRDTQKRAFSERRFSMYEYINSKVITSGASKMATLKVNSY